LAWDCGAGHYFEFIIHRRLVLNIFGFPVSTANLLGDFYNKRQSAANSFLRFSYSFVFLSSTIGPAIRTPPIGIAQRTLKKQTKHFLLGLPICAASPIGAAGILPLCLLAADAMHRL
jgi:hypothetical protein